MRITTVTLVLGLLVCTPCLADPPGRWVPEHCTYGDASDHQGSTIPSTEADTDRLWNDAYRQGFLAIQRGEYDLAESEMCRALVAAREFGPRDWRFAETLDELGLIAFQLRDFDVAERVQGAAIAEMLLAVGPHGEPLRDRDDSEHSVIRPDCRSGIQVYTTRLGWIHERVSGRTSTAQLESSPWRIFEAGYLPLDADLAHRLDWLVSQYLLEENVTAAEALTELQREILGDPR